MIPAQAVVQGLYGAYRLARLDPRGMSYLDRSIEGFWRSFFAAVVAAPAFVLLVVLETIAASTPEAETDWARVVLVEGIAYAIGWVAFPLAMFYVAEAIGRGGAYVGFVVAYNWAAVLQTAAYLLVAALTSGGALPPPLGDLLSLALILAILAYQWFIARTALNLGAHGAIGIVALDVVISLIITGVARAMV